MMSDKPASDGMKILDRMIGDDAELREMYEQAKMDVQIAQLVYDVRSSAGLSQQELAQMLNMWQKSKSF